MKIYNIWKTKNGSGHQDSRIALVVTRSLVEGMAKKLKLITTVDYRYWLEKKEVGGWTERCMVMIYCHLRATQHPLHNLRDNCSCSQQFYKESPSHCWFAGIVMKSNFSKI